MPRSSGLLCLMVVSGAALGAPSHRSAVIAVSASTTISAVSIPGAARQNWRQAALSVAAGDSRRTVIEAEVDAEHRAGTDVRLAARATTRTAGGSYYFGAGFVPNATFRDRWRLSGGAEQRLGTRWQASLDLRLAHYRDGTTAAFEPGLTFGAAPALALSARAINLVDPQGRYRAGAALRADFTPRGSIAWFASIARYPDREEDGVRRLDALAAGMRADIGDHWQLRLSAAQERRERSYRRRSVGLSLSYRPAAR